VREQDAARRAELIVRAVDAFTTHVEDGLDELDRVFPLYLGLLAADLDAPTALYLANAAMVFPLTPETRAIAAGAIEAYRDKIKGTPADEPPKREGGVRTGPFVVDTKASGVLQQFIDVHRAGELPERKKRAK